MKKLLFFLLFPVMLNAAGTSSSGVSISGGVAAPAGCSGAGDLGYTTDAAGEVNNNNLVNQYTAGSNICVNYGHAYLYGSVNVKMIIMSDSGSDTPGSVLACSESVLLTNEYVLRNFTFTTPYQITSGTKYWIGFINDSGLIYVHITDAGSGVARYHLTLGNYSTCAVSNEASMSDRRMSLWVSDD